jgi:dolichol-phosphate mannosyltransferase
VDRRDHVAKKFFSSAFYNVLGYLTGSEQDAAVANYGIYHRKVIDAVCSMREQIRYFPTMIKWVGFRKTLLDVKHGSRDSGSSNYNMRKLMNLAFDILLANSEKPIKLIVKVGFLISSLAFLASLVVMIQYFRGVIEVAGYTSMVLSIWLLGGLVIMLLGIIGMYVGKVFQYVKERPIYIVQEQKNLHEN